MLGKLQHEQWLVRIAVCGTNLFSVGAHTVRVGGVSGLPAAQPRALQASRAGFTPTLAEIAQPRV